MLFSERKKGQKKKGDFRVLKKLCSQPVLNIIYEKDGNDSYGRAKYRYRDEAIEHYFLLKTKSPIIHPRQIENLLFEEQLFDLLECSYQFLEEYNTENEKIKRHIIFEYLLNQILVEWGFRMREGMIENLPEDGMNQLVDEIVPTAVIPGTREKMDHAISLFFKRDSAIEDKKSAIRALADLLEHVRQDLQKRPELEADEHTLFNIINNYSIRHHRQDQSLISEPYITWLFYATLNTLITFLKIKDEGGT